MNRFPNEWKLKMTLLPPIFFLNVISTNQPNEFYKKRTVFCLLHGGIHFKAFIIIIVLIWHSQFMYRNFKEINICKSFDQIGQIG